MANQNKKIIVSYQKEWNNDGTCYTQTIKISKNFLLFLAKKIDDEIKSNYKNYCNYAHGDKLKAECYLQQLDTTKNKHFLKLTQLRFIYPYLQFNFDTSRVKTNRNTIIEVI